MIKIEGLSKSFGEHLVLNNINLHVEQGDVFGIVGHSGAGKSTLLHCLNGLESYHTGSVKVMGEEVRLLGNSGIKNLRRNMGMIFQHFSLMNRKNVWKNIAFPMEIWHMPKAEIKNRVDELLELVGLEEKRFERVGNLSGGQKQRVGIARALALNPKILLCDEATSALDPRTTISILELLDSINKKLGLTIVLITHQMEVIKMICNKTVLLDNGLVAASGETEAQFLSPSPALQRLIQDEYAVIPTGVNIRLKFPRQIAKNAVITQMATDLGINFSIVGGRLERYRDHVLGYLIINVKGEDYSLVVEYLKSNNLYWEIVQDGQHPDEPAHIS